MSQKRVSILNVHYFGITNIKGGLYLPILSLADSCGRILKKDVQFGSEGAVGSTLLFKPLSYFRIYPFPRSSFHLPDAEKSAECHLRTACSRTLCDCLLNFELPITDYCLFSDSEVSRSPTCPSGLIRRLQFLLNMSEVCLV